MNYFNNFLYIIILIVAFTICPVIAKETANSTLYVSDLTQNSISWHYTYLTDARPLGATFDGVIIEGWKTDYIYNYTAADLSPNTTHEFCIFGDATSNCESATTTQSLKDKSLEVVAGYTLFILALIFIIAGLFVPFIAWLGVGFAIIGILDMQSVSFWGGFVFMVIILAGIFVAFKDIQGD
jgi:uncharacterized membrane protein